MLKLSSSNVCVHAGDTLSTVMLAWSPCTQQMAAMTSVATVVAAVVPVEMADPVPVALDVRSKHVPWSHARSGAHSSAPMTIHTAPLPAGLTVMVNVPLDAVTTV
jgi:hypothetical protein